MSPAAVLATALMITGFVFVMMLIVEVVNVASAGTLQGFLRRGGAPVYVAAGMLGAAPGCLGSFAAVALYVHGALPLGALVANMIATSGDEAFVMLALFPGRALLLFAILLAWGIVVGLAVDRFMGGAGGAGGVCPSGLAVHEAERVRLLSRPISVRDWSFPRATLAVALGLFILAVGTGAVGHGEKGWVRGSLLGLSLIALWIALTAPEHFLEEHLWRHVAREHAPRIFLWVLGVLVVLELAHAANVPVESLVRQHPLAAVLLAALIGIVPESGPHLVFVTLFAQEALPFSVLAASSVAQDGHGMLPLLAESRKDFLKVKAINVLAGAALGGLMLAAGL